MIQLELDFFLCVSYKISLPSALGFESFDQFCSLHEVTWGQPNMMEAERRLLANALLDFSNQVLFFCLSLANALLDFSNQRFVLLPESCIPFSISILDTTI